jgi:hypothetical protein
LTTRRGNPEKSAGKVNTHTGDNAVSIYPLFTSLFTGAVACVLAGVRGRLLYWMDDNTD